MWAAFYNEIKLEAEEDKKKEHPKKENQNSDKPNEE